MPRSLVVFAFLFLAYASFGSREPPWNDAEKIHLVAESIVWRGALDIPLPTSLVRDGKSYSEYAFLTSLLHVPGVAINRALASVWPEAGHFIRAMTSHIAPTSLAAATGVLFVALGRQIGASAVGSLLGLIMLAFGTMFAVYARAPWSEMTQTACYVALVYATLRASAAQTRKLAIMVGLAAGMLVNAKYVLALALPGAALYWGVHLYRAGGPRRLVTMFAWAALGLLPGVAMACFYNYARTGSMLRSGYAVDLLDKDAVERSLFGLWGLFFSLGKGAFFYCPPLVLSVVALPRVIRSRPSWGALVLLTAIPVLLFYSRLVWWNGDWAWGPRYLSFVIPILMLPACFLLGDLWAARRRIGLALAAAVFALGLAVQVVGGAFYWDHYIRIAQSAQRQWLGVPNRTGTARPNDGSGCDPCIEDLYALNWLPAFQPIEGHAWLFWHVGRDHDWRRAELSAPWRRYTSMGIDLESTYPRARFDWWVLDAKERSDRVSAIIVLVMLLAACAWCGRWLGRDAARSDQRKETP